MTDLATGVLALLPVHGQAVEDIVAVARLDRYLPMNGHVVIDFLSSDLCRSRRVSSC